MRRVDGIVQKPGARAEVETNDRLVEGVMSQAWLQVRFQQAESVNQRLGSLVRSLWEALS